MYCRFPGSRLIFTNGRGTDIEYNFADSLGIELETAVFLEDSLAWDYVLEQLERQRPVMLDTDSLTLPYLTSAGLLPDTEDIHFGGHKLVVSRFDPEKQIVVLHDYAWADPIYLPLEQLRRARNPINCAMASPQNRTYLFHFGNIEPDWKLAMVAGLLRSAPLMRNSNRQTTELVALDRFCRQVTRWPRVLSEQDAYLNTRVSGYMLDKGATGGGAFRNLFSRFLEECSELLDRKDLLTLSRSYHDWSFLWTEIADLLTESSRDLSKGLYGSQNHAQVLIDEIWRRENEGVELLEEISCGLLV